MNTRLLIDRLLKRPNCVAQKGATFSLGAKVLNASKSSSSIKIGAMTRVEGELFIFAHGGDISIGDWCFIGPNTRIWSAMKIHIGNRVLISHNCNIMDSLTHPIDPTERHLQFKSILTSGHPTKIDLDEEPVILEDNVWIGAGTTILKGTCIGENSIIGAGSVVTKDIPPNSIAAGNPAKVIKHISQRSINSKRAGIPIATIAQ